jgi:hypothetical protein
MKDSNGGTANKPGEVDQRKLKNDVDNWGKLPEKERVRVKAALLRGLPAKDRAVMEAYFEKLNSKSKK